MGVLQGVLDSGMQSTSVGNEVSVVPQDCPDVILERLGPGLVVYADNSSFISLLFSLTLARIVLEAVFLKGDANRLPICASGSFCGLPSAKCLEQTLV